MRLLVGVALTLLCVGLDALHQQSPFLAGKRYEYEYYGHFLAGALDVGHLQNGFSIKSQVEIQVPEQGRLIVKLQNIQTATLEQQLPHVDENEIPWQYQGISGPLKSQLEMPIRVSYSQGKVQSFEASRSDLPESVNIKKAIVSLLNLDTSESNQVSQGSNHFQGGRLSRSNEAGSNGDDVSTYSIMEDNIGGECETFYSLESNPWPGNPDQDVVNATKIINYRNCEKRPQWIRTSHVPNQCADCSADKQHPMGTTAIIEYDIKVERSELVIEEIRSKGQTIFAPFSADSNTINANLTQILTLSKSDSNARNVPIPDPMAHPTLQYKFPTSEWAKSHPNVESTKLPLIPFLTMEKDNPLEEAKQLLQEVASEISSDFSQFNDETPLKVTKLVKALRKLKLEEVDQFYSDATRERQVDPISPRIAVSDKQIVAVQALAMTGSNPASLKIIQLVESRQINGEQALHAVQGLTKNMLEPTPEIVRDILKMVKSQAVKENSQLYKSAWLTFAIIVKQACNGQNDDIPSLPRPPHMKRPYCSNELEKQYLQELNLKLRETQSREQILLFLKALSLTELPMAAEHISQYASGDALSKDDDVIQEGALQALREIGKNAPELVKEIAELEFFDTDNDNAVRIAAIRAIMASKPDYSDMERLAIFSANNENSDDVAGYVYSLFDSLANSTTYCNQEIANNAQQLLALLDEEDNNGIFGSKVYESSQILENLGVSTHTYASWTSSNTSTLPQSFNLRINNTVAGYSHVPLQINVQTRGLQTVINRIIGPQANLLNIKTLKDLFKPESLQEDTPRTDINQKLNLNTRTDDDFFISANIKSEREARQIYLDHQKVSQLIEAALQSGVTLGNMEVDVPVHYHRLSISHEIKRQIPTLLGLPLLVAVSDPTIFSVRGKVTVRTNTATTLPLPIPVAGSVHVEANLKVSYSSRSSITVGLYNPFKTTVSAVILATPTHVVLPLTVNLDVNLLEGKISLKVKPQDSLDRQVAQSPKVLSFKVQPMTLQYSAKSSKQTTQPGKSIHSKQAKEFELDLSKKVLGLPVVLRGKSEQDWINYAAIKNQLNDYDSVLSLLNTYWATPDFSSREYEVILSGSSPHTKELAVVLEYKYVPTPSEQQVLSSKIGPKGFFTVLSGFGRIPEKCKNENALDPYSFSYGKHDSSVLKPWYANTADNRRQNKPQRDSPIFVLADAPHHHHQHQQHQQDEPERQIRQQANVETQPRQEQISTLMLKLTATAKAETESKSTATLLYVHNEDTGYDSAEVKLVLSNVQGLQQEVTVCARASVKYPILPCDFDSRMDPANIDGITANITIDDCSQNNRFISIKARAIKSKEQLALERVKKDWYYEQCQEDIKNDQKLSYACGLAMEEITSLNKISVSVIHSQVPLWLKNVTHKVDNYLKQAMYKQMSNNPIDVNNPANEFKIKLVFHDEVPALDLTIVKPTEETEFRKVHYQQALPYLQPPNVDKSMLKNVIDDLTADSESPSCGVMRQSVRTFDNQTYDFDFTNCYQVVAKDCSPNDLFAVSVAQLQDQKQKKLKINLLEHTILIEPVQGTNKKEFQVTVDNQSVQPSENAYIAVKAPTDDGQTKIIAHISKYGEDIFVQAPLHGVQVSFDSQDVNVEVSNLWKGKVCGMCGEFRGETEKSFQGPDQCLYPTEDSFGLNYTIKAFTCYKRPADNEQHQCVQQSRKIYEQAVGAYDRVVDSEDAQFQDASFSIDLSLRNPLFPRPKEGDDSCYVKRNQISFKYGMRCFSLQAQTECANNCQTVESTDVTIKFHCLPDDDTRALQLTRDRDVRALLVLANKRSDMVQRVTIAKVCEPMSN